MQSLEKNKIAFVVPWFGECISGGAESETRALISRLSEYFEVEVLTTCVKDFLSDWNDNYWKPGEYEEMGVKVRRFLVDKQDIYARDKVNAKLMKGRDVSAEEERVFLKEMIKSSALNEFVRKGEEYRRFVFIPYMFGTTFDGVLAAGEKSVLIPCLHDEAYARLEVFQDVFDKAGKVLFHVEAEKRLAERLYGKHDDSFFVVGEGVDIDLEFEKGAFRKKYGLGGFVLYAGRKDSTKNVPLLVDYFRKYVSESGSDLKLVLIGPCDVESDDVVLDLGFVSKEDKYNAMVDSLVLCQPSLNESFSIVVMESWLCGRPVLVHGGCEVTRDHVLESNGGLYFNDYFDFYETLRYFEGHREVLLEMGGLGRDYVLQNFTWEKVIQNYLKYL